MNRKLFNKIACLLVLTAIFPSLSVAEEKAATLNDSLQSIVKASSKKIPEPAKKVMANSQMELEKEEIVKKVVKVGDKFPNETLLSTDSSKVDLHKTGEGKNLVVVFYRGEWCPYCNTHLKFLEKSYVDFAKAGAEVVAISPEKPEFTLSAKSKNALGFQVLSDPENKLSRKAGLVFELDEDLKEVYKSFGIDLEKNQGNGDWELPLAATFVLDKERNVAWRFVDVDYRKRAAPADILKALGSL